MRLIQIAGKVRHCTCSKCKIEGPGGTQSYFAASDGLPRFPLPWYQDAETDEVFCNDCALSVHAKEFLDPTRSVNIFYANTYDEILDKNL